MVAQIDSAYMHTGVGNVLARILSYSLFEGRPLTTRGRWANPLLARFLEALARRPVRRIPDRTGFVVGTGRSGTTMLGTILSTHSDIGWLNEPKLLWHIVYPYEDIIGSFDQSDRGRLCLSAEDASPTVRNRGRSLTTAYLATTRRSVLIDKYPELLFRLDFVTAIFPAASFIGLQRRAVPCATSIVDWNMRRAYGGVGWWGAKGRKWRTLYRELIVNDPELADTLSGDPAENEPIHMAFAEWLLNAELMTKLAIEDRLLLLRYEEFCADPVPSLRKICDYLQIPYSSTMEKYALLRCRPARSSELSPGFNLPSVLVSRIQDVELRLGYTEL